MSSTDINVIDVRTSDFERWADYAEAKTELPEIVKQLVFAAGRQVETNIFKSREENYNSGWDGIVHNNKAHQFIPEGESYWEIGTNKRYQKKAEEDYKKRTKQTKRETRKNSTFVFVTPRLWTKKGEWEKSFLKHGEWKNIKVIDRTDLTDWINQYPIQKYIFLKRYLNISVDGISDLDSKWEIWSKATSPNMPAYLYNLEIAKHKQRFKNWAKGEPERSFVIAADSELEGLSFLKCLLDEEDLLFAKIKCVVFSKSESIFPFVSKDKECIAIISGSELADTCLGCGCTKVIQIITRGMPFSKIDVNLGLLDYDSTRKFAGENDGKEIEKHARDCGYNRVLLRLALSISDKTPKWIYDRKYLQIINSLSFLGYIECNNVNLQNAVLGLNSNNFKNFTELQYSFEKLLNLDETPVWSSDRKNYSDSPTRYIGVHSPMHSIKYARNEIDNEFVKNLEKVIDKIFFKNYTDYHDCTREHILKSLLICSEYGSEWGLSAHHELTELCKKTTAAGLMKCKRNCENEHIIRCLSYFAELCPSIFIDFIEKENSLSNYIDSYLGTAIHILGKNPIYFISVITILIRIFNATADENKRKSIIDTTNAFLFCAIPQTNANLSLRIEATQLLADTCPDLCWEVCSKQFFGYYITAPVYPSARYRRDTDYRQCITKPEMSEILYYQQVAIQHMLKLSCESFTRIKKLVNIMPNIQIDFHDSIWKTILQFSKSINPEVQGCLCAECFDILEYWKTININNDAYNKGIKYFNIITNDNIFLANIGEFFYSKTYEGLTQVTKRELILDKCLHQKINIFEYISQLEKLDMRAIGNIFAQLTDFDFKTFYSDYFKHKFITLTQFCNFVLGYTSEWNEEQRIVFLKNNLSSFQSLNDAVLFALYLPPTPALFNFIKGCGNTINKIYWENIKYLGINEYSNDDIIKIEFALSNLREDLAIDSVLYSYTGAPLPLLKKIVKAYAKALWNRHDYSSCYEISDILNHLHDAGALSSLNCAYIEYRICYNSMLSAKTRYYYFSSYFAKNPAHFCKVLNYIYANKNTETCAPILYTHFSNFYHMIEKCAISLYCNNIYYWCQYIYGHTHVKKEKLDDCIGNILVAGSVLRISDWLNYDICTCIETFYSKSLASSFSNALLNSRGVTSRSIDAGGIHEYNLINSINLFISKKLSRFPKTSGLLKTFIETLEVQAHNEDDSAMLMKR